MIRALRQPPAPPGRVAPQGEETRNLLNLPLCIPSASPCLPGPPRAHPRSRGAARGFKANRALSLAHRDGDVQPEGCPLAGRRTLLKKPDTHGHSPVAGSQP
jgi:hypothetical protein